MKPVPAPCTVCGSSEVILVDAEEQMWECSICNQVHDGPGLCRSGCKGGTLELLPAHEAFEGCLRCGAERWKTHESLLEEPPQTQRSA